MFLSIIIPVYNAGNWIERCLDSVLTQDIDDYEVIAINDGSTDNSLHLMEQYKERNCQISKRLRILTHDNQGVSATRNRGIEEACGEYITFVDADDYVIHDSLSEIRDKIIDSNARPDLILLGIQIVTRTGVIRPHAEYKRSLLERSDFNNFPDVALSADSPCSKFFKRSFLTSNNIKFDKSMKMWEDIQFNLKYLSYCSSILQLHLFFYVYERNYQSATTKFYGNELIYFNETLRTSYFDCLKNILYKPSIIDAINRRIAFNYLFAIYSIYRGNSLLHKRMWLKKYWEAATQNDPQWSYQLNSGIPKTIGIIGRKSLFLLDKWLRTIFTVEKLKHRYLK